MAGLVPAIHEGPAHLRRQARKALRPSAFLPVAPRRDSFLRRPGVDGRDKPGHDGKGSTNEQQTGRPTDNAIRAKIRALIALAVVGKESGAWRRWRTAPSRRHGRACPGHPRRPSASDAGKREKPCDRPPSCRSRRGGTRSCGGPAWMAGTSPAMTARVRRTNSKPVDQQHNAIRAKIRALIALAVVGEGIGSMAEVADGAIKASWPGLSRPSPKAQRIDAGKREKPCDRPPSCRSRRGGTRSCGGPAWMAGTSPAMTARVRRTNSKPVDQQITP